MKVAGQYDCMQIQKILDEADMMNTTMHINQHNYSG